MLLMLLPLLRHAADMIHDAVSADGFAAARYSDAALLLSRHQ